MAEDAIFSEEETPEQRDFDYDRTVALSDGVFAIALTLLVLNVSVPNLAPLHQGKIGADLLDRGSEFASYALSFAVIGLMWVRHHAFFRALEKIDLTLTVLNLIYLGFIAFLPYPTRVLGLYASETAAVVLYASNLAILSAIAGLTRVYAQRGRMLSVAGAKRLEEREHWLIVPGIFVASIAIAFVSPTAAKFVWVLLAIPHVRGFRGPRGS